ncbi:MAG: UDP-glucose 4-epimerase GalE, partial [Candidatus Omnitrophica bacterium]|nr:UDP-glucose 4-epimerase GalE [Candidatus Omnitrophota bacterium]
DAIDMGCNGAELDTQITLDNRMVVYRLKDLNGRAINEYTLDEIKQIDPEIPSLEEVLRLVNGRLNLDIHLVWAEGENKQAARRLVSEILALGVSEWVTCASIFTADLDNITQEAERLGAVVTTRTTEVSFGFVPGKTIVGPDEKLDKFLAALKKGGCDRAMFYLELLTPEIISKVHAQGMKVSAVGRAMSAKEVSALINLGVDEVMLFNPKTAKEAQRSFDQAKPREGYSAEEVAAEAVEIISSGKINNTELWAKLDENHPWVKRVISYYERTGELDKAKRLRSIVNAGHLRMGPLTGAFGANVVIENENWILIASNDNRFPVEALIHEANGGTHEENLAAEIAFKNDFSVLVSGGAGLVASFCVRRLLEKGYKVVIFDNLTQGNRQLVPQNANVTFIEGDIADSKKLQEAIIKHNCGYVMNFAASIEVGESRTNPAKYFYNNTVNTINLIQVAAETGIRYFIHSSTAAVYGEPESVPIDETAPLNANNAYGESKLLIERSMECYEEKYGMHFVRFRYFNVAGASLDGSCGEFHRPKESHIIPRLIFITYGWLTKFKITAFQVEDEKQKALYEGNSEIQDTTPIRDYINVLDLADLHELGCVYLSNGGASGAFNAGTGEGSSLKQVADAVRKFSGKQLPVVIQPSGREGEPTRLIASSNKAKEFLGWSPSRTLNDSVESLVKWYNSPLFKSMQANKNEPPVDEDVKKRADFAMSVIKALAANKVVSEDFKFELLYRMLVDTVEAAILRKDAQKGTELFTLSNRLVNMSRCIFTECAAISAAEGNNEIRRTSSLIRERVRGNNEIVTLVKSIIALTEAVEEKVIYAALISNLDLAADFVSGIVLLKKPGDFNKAQASWLVPVLNREMLATRRGRSIQKMWGNFIRAVFSGMGFDALIFTVKVADLISNIEAIESYRGIYYHADTPVFFVVERDGKYEDNFSGVVNIAKHLPERMKESGLDYENFRGLLVHLAGQGKRNKPLTNTEGRGKKHFMSRASGDEYLARTLIESYQLFDEHTPGII